MFAGHWQRQRPEGWLLGGPLKIVVRLEWNAAGSGWIVYFDALLLMLWACTGAKNTLLFSHQFRFKW